MPQWFPLHAHSDMSLLDGLSKPQKIADRLIECGYKGSACTDHGSISACVDIVKEFKKRDLKPILASEMYLCEGDPKVKDVSNRSLSHLCILARDLDSWRGLVRATSAANHPDHYYYKPRLNIETLAGYAKGCVTFSGHPGSDLADCLFQDRKLGYGARTREDALAQLRPDHEEVAAKMAGRYQELFGKENFFLEIQLIDAANMPAAAVVAEKLRELGKKLDIPCVATADSHYPRREDARDQRVLLCTALQTNLKEIERKLANDEDIGLGGFFRSCSFHIPSLDEMVALHTEEELANSLRIAEMCTSYDILSPPRIPSFATPDGQSADDYLRHLCREGWKQKIQSKIPKADHARYADRVKMEMGVISEAGLSPYFLIVHDFCDYTTKVLKAKRGRGRGSAAGCLISYLLNITDVDPIRYDLLFERFYNAGRNTPGKPASLPDVDCDLPKYAREKVVEYLRSKYGENRVANMVTFGRMQGRSALKDVFRAHGKVSFEEANEITKFVPDEAAIADELQQMREDTGEASIIDWALEHNKKGLQPWVEKDDDGNLTGDYAPYFEQARRLEGTKRSQGKHASGIVISSVDLSEVCPMVYDKNSKSMMAGMEMGALESLGCVKFDCLGLSCLDRIQSASHFIRTGKCDG